jgi:dienelactone hydrolase
MHRSAAVLFVLVVAATGRAADDGVVRVGPDRKGFHWPYYLYVPPKVREAKGDGPRTILVLPNNTGTADDDPDAHDRAARKRMDGAGRLADQLGVVVLQPVFPRPKADWRVYTHALDRDALLTDKAGLRRLDRQLVAMIDHARDRLAGEGVRADARVLVFGFSAAGMFANRFAFLHPDRVKAAAVGSPGGWPIAPVAEHRGKALRYPVGVADLEAVAGKPLDAKALAAVPLFVFMGDKDANDSVTFRDSYEEEDEKLISELFGKTPVARWAAAEKLYRDVLPKATFKLYPGAGHTVTPEMQKDLAAFFAEQLGR